MRDVAAADAPTATLIQSHTNIKNRFCDQSSFSVRRADVAALAFISRAKCKQHQQRKAATPKLQQTYRTTNPATSTHLCQSEHGSSPASVMQPFFVLHAKIIV